MTSRLTTAAMIPIMAVTVLTPTGCGGDENASTTLQIDGAWARPTPPGATNGVVHLHITSPVDDTIDSITVDTAIAQAAEMHETMGGDGASPMPNMPEMATDGEMTMTPLDTVELPAHQTVAFEPGGKHIMLRDIARPLAAGTTFDLIVHLVHGGEQHVNVRVTDRPGG